MLIKESVFNTNSACLTQAMAWLLAKNGIMQFLPKHMEANKISAKLQ